MILDHCNLEVSASSYWTAFECIAVKISDEDDTTSTTSCQCIFIKDYDRRNEFEKSCGEDLS